MATALVQTPREVPTSIVEPPNLSITPSAPTFDPSIHLAYQPPKTRISMNELGLEEAGISPMAVTEPFPLFTEEAIREMRSELLNDEILTKHTFSSHMAAYQARSFPPKLAPFIFSAWNNPDLLRAVSDAAQLELTPIMPLEVGHTNFQIGVKGKDGVRELRAAPSPPWIHTPEIDEQRKADTQDEKDDVVHWHHDSYPFVCVVMLSDCTTMIGGETAIQKGDGTTMKVRGPTLGTAVVMQGRHINHKALRAFNAPERLTMVTSFRAKDPMIRDASVLTTIRPICKPNQLNYQWTSYRIKLLSERFAEMHRRIESKREEVGVGEDGTENRVIDTDEMGKWIGEQIGYLKTTVDEWYV